MRSAVAANKRSLKAGTAKPERAARFGCGGRDSEAPLLDWAEAAEVSASRHFAAPVLVSSASRLAAPVQEAELESQCSAFAATRPSACAEQPWRWPKRRAVLRQSEAEEVLRALAMNGRQSKHRCLKTDA